MSDTSMFLLWSKWLKSDSLRKINLWIFLGCDLPLSLLEFSQPWVSNGCSQDGSEITEAAEGVVYRGGSVFTPMQEIQEVQGQHSWGKKKGGGGEQNKTDALKWFTEKNIWSGLWRWSSAFLTVKWLRGDCWAVELGPLGVVGMKRVMLSVQIQYSSLQSMYT